MNLHVILPVTPERRAGGSIFDIDRAACYRPANSRIDDLPSSTSREDASSCHLDPDRLLDGRPGSRLGGRPASRSVFIMRPVRGSRLPTDRRPLSSFHYFSPCQRDVDFVYRPLLLGVPSPSNPSPCDVLTCAAPSNTHCDPPLSCAGTRLPLRLTRLPRRGPLAIRASVYGRDDLRVLPTSERITGESDREPRTHW